MQVLSTRSSAPQGSGSGGGGDGGGGGGGSDTPLAAVCPVFFFVVVVVVGGGGGGGSGAACGAWQSRSLARSSVRIPRKARARSRGARVECEDVWVRNDGGLGDGATGNPQARQACDP